MTDRISILLQVAKDILLASNSLFESGVGDLEQGVDLDSTYDEGILGNIPLDSPEFSWANNVVFLLRLIRSVLSNAIEEIDEQEI